jgi:NAD(P)-dependent dehydrogenase (short-subunit alcohol dehydrogenase family)
MTNAGKPAAAIVVGVGPRAGLGGALCRRFAREGLHVFVAGRTTAQLEAVAADIRQGGGVATPVATDTTREADVLRLFEAVQESGMPLELVAYNAGNNRWSPLLDMSAQMFEDLWRVCCLGGFLVGREAARCMVPHGRGSILFTGATASVRGRPPFAAFASAKAALRSLAQAMAREFGPQGIHVAHVIIDGAIDGDKINQGLPEYAKSKGADGMLNIDAIAGAFWYLHTQHRSAWTQELDLRPFKETF